MRSGQARNKVNAPSTDGFNEFFPNLMEREILTHRRGEREREGMEGE